MVRICLAQMYQLLASYYVANVLYVCILSLTVSLHDTDYALRLHGQDKISVGMSLALQCTIVTSTGSPVENSEIQLSLVLPTGEVIIGRELNTIATLEHNGTYSCIAYLIGNPIVVTLPVIVYGELSVLYI